MPNKDERLTEKKRQDDLQRRVGTLKRDVNGMLEMTGTESRIIYQPQHVFVNNADQEDIDRHIKSGPPTPRFSERNTTYYGTALNAQESLKSRRTYSSSQQPPSKPAHCVPTNVKSYPHLWKKIKKTTNYVHRMKTKTSFQPQGQLDHF